MPIDLYRVKTLKSTKNVEKANMERTASTTTADSGFWTTIELLMGKEYKDSNWEAGSENLEGDFRALVGARGRRRKRSSRSNGPTKNTASIIAKQMENTLLVPGMELRNLWGRCQQAMGSGQDREVLRKLQQRNRQERLDAQQRRIKAREVDEMDRLKKLILSGRSPLDDCPPEIKSHPVFVFWRLVNREVEKMHKARVDAYYKKYRRARRSARRSSPRELQGSEESSLVSCAEGAQPPLSPAQLSPSCSGYPNPGEGGTPEPITYSPVEPVNEKYEDEDIKKLRNMTTVEELYQMADRIIGVPRETNMAR